jgi:hypothetical protein
LVRMGFNSNNDYEFSTEDFGVGLDDEDVRNIISKYGKSTKRSSNNELGMFGLGFKAPLAYSSSFYFVCRKNGVERKYMMYEGEDVNTIDLLYEIPTAERNGVKVIIPVRWGDRETFYHKINEQLAYFENVYFDVSVSGHIINNSFKIYRGEHFQYSELVKDQHLHICLDNVYYPIDFGKLGINPLEFPVGLRFGLEDGIYPTPNREAIRYTQEVKEKILFKLKLVADFFIDKYNDQLTECESFLKVRKHYEGVKEVDLIEGVKLKVGYLTVFSNKIIKEPTLKGVKHLNLKKLVDKSDDILKEYQVTNILQRGKIKEPRNWKKVVGFTNISPNRTYFHKDKISEVKKAYLRSLVQNNWDTYRFIRKSFKFSLFGTSYDRNKGYHWLLNLGNVPRQHWREAIVEFKNIEKSIVETWMNIDDIVVPQHFIDSHKKARISRTTKAVRRQKMKGDIIVKLAVPLERFVDGKSCKFVPDTWKLGDIPNMKSLVVYGHHDDQLLLDKLYAISLNTQKIKIISLSTTEIKNLKEMEFQNVISYEEFMKGKNKPFKRLVTAYVINKLIEDNNYVFKRKELLKNVNVTLYDKLELLESYKSKNYRQASKEIYNAMLEVATNERLFDYTIYYLYLEIKTTLDRLYFLNTYMGMIVRYRYDQMTIIYPEIRMLGELLKYHKYRVNLDHYKSN